jgi:Holliday junction resolvasome RuvABC endonuclease subunit
MKKIKILSLDMSTKTGWSLAETGYGTYYNLIDGGTLTKRNLPELDYPKDYLEWAHLCVKDIFKLMDTHTPDEIVIEETSKGSKNNMSQKILEFIHFLVATEIVKRNIKTTYYRTEEWRRICGCILTADEKKRNKVVRQSHKQGNKNVKDPKGKRIGKVGKKHVNVRRANELFDLNLQLKDEDRADAILMGYAHFLNKRSQKK